MHLQLLSDLPFSWRPHFFLLPDITEKVIQETATERPEALCFFRSMWKWNWKPTFLHNQRHCRTNRGPSPLSDKKRSSFSSLQSKENDQITLESWLPTKINIEDEAIMDPMLVGGSITCINWWLWTMTCCSWLVPTLLEFSVLYNVSARKVILRQSNSTDFRGNIVREENDPVSQRKTKLAPNESTTGQRLHERIDADGINLPQGFPNSRSQKKCAAAPPIYLGKSDDFIPK